MIVSPSNIIILILLEELQMECTDVVGVDSFVQVRIQVKQPSGTEELVLSEHLIAIYFNSQWFVLFYKVFDVSEAS